MTKSLFLINLCSLLYTAGTLAQTTVWKAEHGLARIKSDAPLEVIKAESKSLRGVIDTSTRSFAFSVRINSFEGFNSEIQRTHFLENYLEQKKYPQATFKGKFIEEIPFGVPGTYSIRAKGNLEIHGIVKERIIRGTLVIKKGIMIAQARFFVPVTDHGITIPKIAKHKIAEEIEVNIEIEFTETTP